jgi:hypothetical protein
VIWYERETPIITDISQFVTADNLIKVEGGGTIIAENTNEDDVPTTITYKFEHNATKEYVDSLVGNVESALDAVIAIQQAIITAQNNLIGGGL